MLRQLQKRFILINMLLVGAVLIAAFAGVTYNNYREQAKSVDRSLSITLERMEQQNHFGADLWGESDLRENGEEPEEKMAFRITFAAIIYDDGSYFRQDSNYQYLTTDELIRAAQTVCTSERDKGRIASQDLYYKKAYSYEDECTYVAFTDSSTLRMSVIRLITIACLLIALSLGALFVISYFLSKIAIRPVRKAWDQQQQFVADASHELKTPLTVILANNNILLSHKDATVNEERKWVESTQAEATHMKKLVDNLLYLARADANKSKPVLSAVNLGEIVMDTSLQIEPAAFEKGVYLDYDEIDTDVTVQGDATKLKQLAHILIDNACKYGDSTEPVKISLKKNGEVVLKVRNSGNPIHPDDIPHIFERFYRSDKARTQNEMQGGYGLGLAIAKSIVDDHDGKIAVTSSQEAGTEFTVTFKNQSGPFKRVSKNN